MHTDIHSILLQAYVDGLVQAINDRPDAMWAAASIGETADVDDVLQWEVKFYWTWEHGSAQADLSTDTVVKFDTRNGLYSVGVRDLWGTLNPITIQAHAEHVVQYPGRRAR